MKRFVCVITLLGLLTALFQAPVPASTAHADAHPSTSTTVSSADAPSTCHHADGADPFLPDTPHQDSDEHTDHGRCSTGHGSCAVASDSAAVVTMTAPLSTWLPGNHRNPSFLPETPPPRQPV